MSATNSQLGIITVLPAGAWCSPSATPRHYYMPCLIRTPNGSGRCFRPQGHGGRHMFAGPNGRVWNVWGDDVHQAKRAKAGEPPC